MNGDKKIIEVRNIIEVPLLFSGEAYYCSSYSGEAYLKEYYLDGKLHRVDGPAKIYLRTIQSEYRSGFYYHGKHFLSAEEWFEALSPDEKEKAVWNIDEWR